mgnify:CR=1 FL=1
MKTPTPRGMAAALAASTLALAGGAQAAARFYEDEGFRGRSVVVDRADGDFRSEAFNDRTSSVIVSGRPYQLCEHADFGGRCIVLQPGEYRSLWRLGFDDRFRRMWRYYLAYCAAGFSTGRTDVLQAHFRHI